MLASLLLASVLISYRVVSLAAIVLNCRGRTRMYRVLIVLQRKPLDLRLYRVYMLLGTFPFKEIMGVFT